MILDKKKSKKLLNRLNEFTEYGATLYYLLEEGRADINDLKTLFFSSDDEKSVCTYGRIIKDINLDDVKISRNKYSYHHPELDKNELNIIYTKKLIEEISSNSSGLIDRNYLDTYNYLLTKN